METKSIISKMMNNLKLVETTWRRKIHLLEVKDYLNVISKEVVSQLDNVHSERRTFGAKVEKNQSTWLPMITCRANNVVHEFEKISSAMAV